MHDLNLPDLLNQANEAVTNLPAPVKTGALQVLTRLGGHIFKRAEKKAERGDKVADAFAAGRAKVIDRLAEAAAEKAASDPELVERALDVMLTENLRKQENREAVASNMADDLKASGEGDGGEIDEDWLNVYSEHAANASTEKMQALWGRVAAGEVRKPGSFSLRTLRFLAEVDKPTADEFESFVKLGFADIVPRTDEWTKGPAYVLAISLEEAGLIFFDQFMSRTIHLENGVGHLIGMQFGLETRKEGAESVQLPIMRLSRIGREIKSILPPHDEREGLRRAAELLKKDGAAVKLGTLRRTGPEIRFFGIEDL